MEWNIDNYKVTFNGALDITFSEELTSELENLLKETRDREIQLTVDVSNVSVVNSRFYGSWLNVMDSYYHKDVKRMGNEKPITFIIHEDSSAYKTLQTLRLDKFFQYKFI